MTLSRAALVTIGYAAFFCFAIAFGQNIRVKSPTGRHVAAISAGAPHGNSIEVLNSSTQRTVLQKKILPFRFDGSIVREIVNLFWGIDDRRLYLVGGCSDTYYCILIFDMSTQSVRGSISRVEHWSVLNKGKYKGHLIVQLRKSTLVRRWDWYWLMDPDGKMIEPIGDDKDLEEFLSSQ